MSKILVSLRNVQRRAMKRMMNTTSDRFEALRCRILLLLDEGRSAVEVARLAFCVRATVYRTVYRFEDLGEDGLVDQRKKAKARKVTPEVCAHLLDYLEHKPKEYGWQRSTWSLELLALQLERDTTVSLTPQHLGRVLKSEGCRRGRPRPALRIPVRGRRKILDSIEQLVASARPNAEVLYVDEADIDLNPRIGLTYIKRGQQPLVLTPGKNVKYYIAGALNARTGRVLYSHGPNKNSSLFVHLLKVLRHSYRKSRVIHLIVDNYTIHKSRETQIALEAIGGRIRLHFLPPYSPEHNRIERLWKQFHDNVTRNHMHHTMMSLWQDVVRFLSDVQPFPGTKVSTLRQAA